MLNSKKPKKTVLSWYEEYDEFPVNDDLEENGEYKVIRKDLIKDVIITHNESDKLRRSIIRHDSKKLAGEVIDIINY